MKQTNNAIKFLMAQYRAIFKNANIAMVAAMVAAALAAGQAQAAPDAITDWTQITSGTIDANTTDGKNLGVVADANKTESNGFDLTITSGSHTIKGKKDQNTLTTAKDKTTTITLSGDGTAVAQPTLTIGGSSADEQVNVTITNLNNYAGTLEINGQGANKSSLTATNIQIGGSAPAANGAAKAAAASKAVVSLGDSGEIIAAEGGAFKILEGGELKFAGADSKATAKSGIVLNGGKISVVDSKAGTVNGALTIDAGAVEANGGAADTTLTFEGLVTVNGGKFDVLKGGTSGGKATLKKGLTMNSGTLTVQGDTTTDKSGKLEVSGDVAFNSNSKLVVEKNASAKFGGNATFASGTVTNSGTIEAVAGATIKTDGTAGLYSASGQLKLTGATLNFTGAALNLSDTAANISGDASSTVLAEKANVTIGNGFEDKAPTVVAGTLTVKGEESAAPDKSFKNRPFLVIESGNVTALNEVKGSPKNTEIAVYNKTSGGSATLTLGNADTTNGKLTDIARVYVGVGQDGKDSTNTLNVNGTWDFANAKLAVGNNGTLNINEGAEVSNIERLQIHGNQVDAKNTVNVNGKLKIKRLLAAESQTTGGDEINVKGTLEILGDGTEETANASGNYANDVQLTKATLNINAGGTVSLAEDAWDDVIKIESGSTAGISNLTVVESGDKTTDFGGWDKSKVNLNAGGTLRIDLSNYKVADKAAVEKLAKELVKDGSKGLVDLGGIGIGSITTNQDGTINLDNMPNVKTEATQNLEVNLGNTTTLDKTYSMGSANVSGNSLTVGTGSTVEFNHAKNGQFATNKDAAAGADSKVSVTLAKDSALNLNGNGSLGDIKQSGTGTTVVLGGNNGTQKVGVVDVATFNQVGGNVTTTGAITATGATTVSGVLNAGGDVSTKTLELSKGAIKAGDNNITVTDASKPAKIFGDVEASSLSLAGGALIAGGADVKLDSLTGANNTKIQVGEDREGGLGATVTTTNLVLSGGSIFVDPDWHKPAGFVVTENLSNAGSTNSGSGTLDGKAYVGKNAALGIGFANTDAGLAELKALVAPYLVDNGGFAENGVKNALVINDSVTVADGNGFVVDHELTSANYTSSAPNNAIKLGAGAALVVTDKAVDEGATAAITFAGNTASLTAGDGAKVVLVGDFTAADKGQKIFAADNGSAKVTGTVKVEAAGGLLVGQITDGSIASLALDPDAEKAIRSEVSAPVGQLFVDFANGKFDGATGAGYDFLATTISAKGYKAIDAAAHAATYAGAQQAAVVSVTTMADAMFGRVGAVGVEAASISATGSQANGGVWLTPMYKSMDADGFNAEGVSYGSDVDAAGVAFGADTVNGNMRFGAVFNIGSGDAEGKGQGNGLKDEFDYYGFGIYSAMGFGNLALVGDASLTVISHDVEGLGLRGKADTSAVTMGLTGQYTVSTPMVDVTPHLGARFIRLNTDSYDLVGADGAIATTDFDVQNVFSVPLGVTLSKGFTTGGCTLAPSADLTITFNGGDTEAKSSTTFTGIKAINMNTEVLDEVTYGLTLGLGAQSGAFGTSFGINYTGSENTDTFGVNAQCRYMF